MDADPLFIRNPNPNMSGDDPLFVINPKYLQPQNVSQVNQPLPMYYETAQPPLPAVPQNPVTTAFTAPGQPLQGQGSMQTDWMSYLPEDAPLAALSIPGTNHSLARSGGPSVQTQTWDISAQLRSGIRYLDIRPCLTTNSIVFRISSQAQPTSIHDFMAAVTAFLREHPKEAILVRIKDECNGGLDFYIRLHQTLNEHYAEFVFPLQIQDVRLGMARGKMVIVKDYNGGPLGGLEYPALDTTDVMTLAGPEEKDLKPLMKAIKNHLKKAMSCGNFEKMFITVASGRGPGFIYQYAANINEILSFYLHKNPKGRVGVIGMDFPPDHLINEIIIRNFKRTKQE